MVDKWNIDIPESRFTYSFHPRTPKVVKIAKTIKEYKKTSQKWLFFYYNEKYNWNRLHDSNKFESTKCIFLIFNSYIFNDKY